MWIVLRNEGPIRKHTDNNNNKNSYNNNINLNNSQSSSGIPPIQICNNKYNKENDEFQDDEDMEESSDDNDDTNDKTAEQQSEVQEIIINVLTTPTHDNTNEMYIYTTQQEAHKFAQKCVNIPTNGDLHNTISKLLKNSDIKMFLGINNDLINAAEHIICSLQKLHYISDAGLTIEEALKKDWTSYNARYYYGQWMSNHRFKDNDENRRRINNAQTCITNGTDDNTLSPDIIECLGHNTPIFFNPDDNLTLKHKNANFNQSKNNNPRQQLLNSINDIENMLRNRPPLVYEYTLEDHFAKKLIGINEPNNKCQQLLDNIGIEIRSRSEEIITNRNTYINECHQGIFNSGPNDLLNTEWNSNQVTIQ